jgi:potassium-transporting ATPase potassium-binding subunit
MGDVMWTLPVLLLAAAIIVSIPLSRYFAWIMDGRYRAPAWLGRIEKSLDTGPQDWKQYTLALIAFNVALFIFGFIVLSIQPLAPLNPLGRGMLSPSTIFNTTISFMTNTNLQHYSGDQHLSNFSQIFFILPNMFLSASVGFCALAAIIRAFRGQATLGNYFVDMWRVMAYIYLPAALISGVYFMHQGMPMTYESAQVVQTLEPGAMGNDQAGQAKPQTIIVGPVAAVIPIKMLGTNGGGFYGMNSAHPLENPTAGSNFLTTFDMMIFPFTLVLMYGRMLGRIRHSVVIYCVMLAMMSGLIWWAIEWDTLAPNPAFTAHAATDYTVASASASDGKQAISSPAVAALPVDQRLGNLEGKELRFGSSAGAVFAAITTDVTCGAVNAEHDSLNPIASISPFIGMWLNCVFGGKGVGMINLLLFLIVGVFLAGQMVGRSPEYLGRKVGAREMKLAMIALLVHPILILGPSGVFAATNWGTAAESNSGAHGFSQIVYQFSSASANNGSAFDGLNTSFGFNASPNSSAPTAAQWDVATGLVMLFSRYLPIIAPIAMAAFLGRKKEAPVSLGTMRDNTITFGFLLLGTIAIIGALLFLPVAALGPLAEHLGPIPFGG